MVRLGIQRSPEPKALHFMQRDLAAARRASARGDVTASRAAHMSTLDLTTAIMLDAEEAHKKGGERMKTCLFGGLDGIITTFAVVAGAGGGGLSVPVVLIMGFSSLVADALSMGVGDALSSKAEVEVAARRLVIIWMGISDTLLEASDLALSLAFSISSSVGLVPPVVFLARRRPSPM